MKKLKKNTKAKPLRMRKKAEKPGKRHSLYFVDDLVMTHDGEIFVSKPK